MKNLLFLLGVFSVSACLAQTPIVSKHLIVNPIYGIHQDLLVWHIDINAKRPIVTIDGEVVTMTATDSLLYVTPFHYTRENVPALYRKDINGNDSLVIPADMKFDILRASPVGLMLKGMITLDMDTVKSATDIHKLYQIVR